MSDCVSLLPPNSTDTERAIECSTARLADVPVPLRRLWDPATCPAELLPWLAWAFSVDRWNPDWSEPEQRAAIAVSAGVHRHKGTVGAVRRAIQPFGRLYRVVEWFDEGAQPYTFRLEIGVYNRGIDEALYTEMESLINSAKPVSRHLSGIALVVSASGPAYAGVAMTDGDELTVGPYSPADIDVTGGAMVGIGAHYIDEVSVYV